jgi:predicted nuclease of predicted toxin-antitoxin system
LKILLDENLDWRLERDLQGHEVASVPRIGWAGIENGALIERAQEEFEVMITMDSKMVSELDIRESKLAIIVLRAPSNRLADTRPLMPKVLARLASLKAGTVTIISPQDTAR